MAIIHIPNDNPQATHEAIDASQPGDELLFDAPGYGATGFSAIYDFARTVKIRKDRYYVMRNLRITVSDDFQGECLFEIEGESGHYVIANCYIDTREKCKAIRFNGTDCSGLIADNIEVSGKEFATSHLL